MRSLSSSTYLYLVLFISLTATIPLKAQNIIITGSVTNNSGAPIHGAKVHLKGKALLDTTASNGNFVITDITEAVNGNSLSPIVPPSLHNGILSVSTTKAQQKVILWMYNCQGKCITSTTKTLSSPGMHSVSLFEDMPSAKGIYFVKVVVEKNTYVLKTVLYVNSIIPSTASKQKGTDNNPQNRLSAVHLRDTVDTIEVTAPGYKTTNTPIGSYIISMAIAMDTLIIDTVPPVITLKGTDTMYVNLGGTYVEPGATGVDNIDGDVTSNIIVSGVVDANTPGTYVITYSVVDLAGNAAERIRIVIVKEIQDTIPPIITIIGPNPINLALYMPYIERGATAFDNVDGDVSANIVITGTVDTSTVGTYLIKYNVSDNAGNPAEERIRTVNIVSSIGDTIIWEDFETGDNNQTKIAQENFTAGDGRWYGKNDNLAGMESSMNPDPITDTAFTSVVVQDAGVDNSKGLHVVFTLKSQPNEYPYCMVGFNIKTPGTYYNLSKMEEFRFYAKGSGSIRVKFLTKMVQEWPDTSQRWGHFGKEITLSSSWTQIVITAADIQPHKDSQQFADNKKWTEAGACDQVTEIEFETNGVNGSVIDLSIDSIRTIGMRVSDIGIK